MCRGYRAPECIGKRLIEATSIGQMIARLALVEPTHLDSPFHRFAFATEREISINLPRDGQHPPIQ
jgi:hypothetical protein